MLEIEALILGLHPRWTKTIKCGDEEIVINQWPFPRLEKAHLHGIYSPFYFYRPP